MFHLNTCLSSHILSALGLLIGWWEKVGTNNRAINTWYCVCLCLDHFLSILRISVNKVISLTISVIKVISVSWLCIKRELYFWLNYWWLGAVQNSFICSLVELLKVGYRTTHQRVLPKERMPSIYEWIKKNKTIKILGLSEEHANNGITRRKPTEKTCKQETRNSSCVHTNKQISIQASFFTLYQNDLHPY